VLQEGLRPRSRLTQSLNLTTAKDAERNAFSRPGACQR
jgi:hypothetical protein